MTGSPSATRDLSTQDRTLAANPFKGLAVCVYVVFTLMPCGNASDKDTKSNEGPPFAVEGGLRLV
jgi:hypothetical protein